MDLDDLETYEAPEHWSTLSPETLEAIRLIDENIAQAKVMASQIIVGPSPGLHLHSG